LIHSFIRRRGKDANLVVNSNSCETPAEIVPAATILTNWKRSFKNYTKFKMTAVEIDGTRIVNERWMPRLQLTAEERNVVETKGTVGLCLVVQEWVKQYVYVTVLITIASAYPMTPRSSNCLWRNPSGFVGTFLE
jgi:hypothetical protein